MRVVFFIFSFAFSAFLAEGQSQDVKQKIDEGISLWENEKYSSAIEVFDYLISQHPSGELPYYYRASSKSFLGNKKGALTDYNILLELNSENREARFKRGLILYDLGRFKEAREEFKYLINNPGGETNTVFFQRSVHGGGVTGVKTLQNNNEGQLYNYISLTYLGEKRFEEALRSLDKALEHDSTNADYCVNKALIYQEMGNKDEALKLYDKALTLNPNHRVAIYNQSVLRGRNETSTKQLSYLNESIEKDPRSPYGYRQRGYYFLQKEINDKAISDFTKAIELDNDDAETYLNRAIVYTKIGSWDNAIKDYDRAAEMAPDWDKVYFNRGNLFYRLRKYEEAIKDYSIALLYQPDYIQAFYQRAIAYRAIGESKRACQDLIIALKKGFTEAESAYSKICLDK